MKIVTKLKNLIKTYYLVVIQSIKKKPWHIFLVAFNIFCVLVIIQVKFKIIYLNPFDFNIDFINIINDIFYIFSTGFILSSIFYFLVNIVPDNKKRKISKPIVNKKIKLIGTDMSYLIEYVKKNNEIDDEKIKNSKICNLSYPSDKQVSFEYGIVSEKEQKFNFLPENINENDFFMEHKNSIIKNCDYILKLPFINLFDISLIKLIASIRDSGYLWDIEKKEEYVKLSNVYYKDFKKFIKYYNGLEKIQKFNKIEIKNIKDIPNAQTSTTGASVSLVP